MPSFLRRLRGGLVLAFFWSLAGVGFGGAIELLANVAPGLVPWHVNVDMWPQTLGMFGFVVGVIFAVLLAVAERRQTRLSFPRFTLLGGAAGALLGGYFLTQGAPVGLFAGFALGGLATAGSMFGAVRFAERRLGVGATPEALPRATALDSAAPPRER